MKSIVIASAAIMLVLSASAFSSAETKPQASDVEIVESAPVETVLDHPDIRNAYEVWIEMLRGAKKTLDIGQFYVTSEKGEPMEDVLSEIRKAAARGVKVRIIADAGFYKTYPEQLDALDSIRGIEVRKIDVKALTGGVMHAKYFIVDDIETFVGSQNFDWRSLKHTQEIGARVKNADFAAAVMRVYNSDWEAAESNRIPKFDSAAVQPSATSFIIIGKDLKIKPVFSPPALTPPGLANELDEILALINSADKDVLLQAMNYSPKGYGDFDGTLDNAIRDAAGKGKKVKLLVADWSLRSPNVNYLKSLSQVPNVEVKFTTIPRFKERYIPFARVEHSKFIVVDNDKAWVSSSNLEPNYFKKSRNVGLVILGRSVAGKLRQVFLDSWTSPYASYIEPEKEYRPPHTGE
jgi:phosphatidylserine/phosphatidylglycerophosphate/cardiolipin synthase-like enzyme